MPECFITGHAQSRSMNDIADTPSTDQVSTRKTLLLSFNHSVGQHAVVQRAEILPCL